MAYQVVARKWRPQRFDQVVGQDHITETLRFAILNNRVAPVYLFTGIRGTGKTTLARIMVKSVNCQNPGETGEPCNKCENCVEIMEGRSPDFVEIDGASNNSVNDVRDIKENVSYRPVKSKYKVYIIDEVHMLSTSAFNALLKTLEEPPSHAIFILATTDPQKIPPTVLSRCQRYDLKRLSLENVVKQLEKILESEQIDYEKEAIYMIAREGEGSMRDSQTILEQLITFGGGKISEEVVSSILGASDKKSLRDILESVAKKDTASAVSIGRNIYYSGKSVEKAAKDILTLLHHIVLYSNLKNLSFLEVSDEEKLWITNASALQSPSDWLRFFRFWSDEYEQIKTSDFSLMLFEVALITAGTFPLTADFKSLVDSLKSGVNTITVENVQRIEHVNVETTRITTEEKPIVQKEVKAETSKEEKIEKPKIIELSEPSIKEEEPPLMEEFPLIEPEIIEETAIKESSLPLQEPETESHVEISDAGSIFSLPQEQSTLLFEPVLPPPIAEKPAIKIPKGDSWESFLPVIEQKSGFMHGALYSAKFEEKENLITLFFSSSLRKMVEEFQETLHSEFTAFFGDSKKLSVEWYSETTENKSLLDKDEIANAEAARKTDEEIRGSIVVKKLEQLGFDLKKISV